MTITFTATQIAGVRLKNKIFRSATHDGCADEHGYPTKRLIKKYEALAKGGVGAIITGYAGVMQNGKSNLKNMLMIDSDDSIPYYQALVDVVHQHETPIFLQIAHCGRQTSSSVTGLPVVAPSPIKDKSTGERPRELTESEIEEIIDNFVESIQRAKKAGFDGVQLHLAHGYLLSSFLSPNTNRRKDKWGGSRENRFKIVKEIFSKARKEVGDFPILVKMNGHEKAPKGVKTEDAIQYAKYLEEVGCDAVEISCGIGEEGYYSIRGAFPFDMMRVHNPDLQKIPRVFLPLLKWYMKRNFGSPEPKVLYNLASASKIKERISIPVIVVGGIRKLKEIEMIIGEQKSDYVSLARPLIMEPGLVNKFREGVQEEAKCINCNHCTITEAGDFTKCYHGKI